MSMRKKITVTGLVQGIGFRPFVAELAEELHLTGQVKNLGGIVEILVSGDKQAVDTFIHRLTFVSESGELPGCRMDSLDVVELSEEGYVDESEAYETCRDEKFHIIESGEARELRRFLPADLPTCDRCLAEMQDSTNRRYRYPFISCTACGPRFSIQRKVPYDRETITMDDFPMCDVCKAEYTQKGNIRRHAQTIACKDCGPKLRYVTTKPDCKIGKKDMQDFLQIEDEQQAISEAVKDLKLGKIGAIKDIGGYHFAFSPLNSRAAMHLRSLKIEIKNLLQLCF